MNADLLRDFWNLKEEEKRPLRPFISGTEVDDLLWDGGESFVVLLPLSSPAERSFLMSVIMLPILCMLKARVPYFTTATSLQPEKEMKRNQVIVYNFAVIL